MLDYNTLNNLVEIFKKQGVRGVTLENGSTLEIKDGALLINGKSLDGVKVIDTDNITALSTETIEGLSAGDIVVKHTGEQTHTYIVTYKEEHQGICISYFAAGYSETVSYDYVTDAWIYNSTDVVTPKEYTGGTGIVINENTIGIDTSTVALKTDIPTEKHLYLYTFALGGLDSYGTNFCFNIISPIDYIMSGNSDTLNHVLDAIVPSGYGPSINITGSFGIPSDNTFAIVSYIKKVINNWKIYGNIITTNVQSVVDFGSTSVSKSAIVKIPLL